MRVYEALAVALRDQGVDTLFGVMGDANMYFADSFQRDLGGRYVGAANESGAVLMAGGHAAVTGGVGAATVTHGAIANTISALLDTSRARYPVVLLAGDTATEDRFNLQNVPQRDLVMPTGAGFEALRSARTVAEDVAVAVRRARVERRPIVLNMPVELQFEELDYEPFRSGALPPAPARPPRSVVEEAVGVLAGCRRPVVIGGRGASGPAARASLIRLAERIGAPLATSLRGKGLFHGEPADVGICGTLATTAGLDAIARSDCLLVFGAGLNALTADGGDLVRGKRIVHCDIDPVAIGRYYPVDVAIVADAGEAADCLVELLDEAELPATGYRGAVIARDDAPTGTSRPRNMPGTVDLTAALRRLDEIVPAERTLVVDGGRFCHEALQLLGVPEPTAYVHALSVGHIGLSVGYGIGAAVGAPGRPTLVVAGDGGFMLGGLAEFNTAVRNGVDLIVAVMNDSAYGAEHYRFVARGLDPAPTTFDWPDLATVATALGGTGVTVREDSDFDNVRKVLAERDRPVLVDVRLDPTAISDPGRH
jgi:acetolactate synthase I/II/III large subunit